MNPKTRNSSKMLLLLAAVLTIMVGGCGSAGKAPQNGPGTGDPSSSKEPGVITVYLDGRKLASAGRDLNGTIYLPVGILLPDEKAPVDETGSIWRVPPRGFPRLLVAESMVGERAGAQEIVPRVEVVDGQVLAPLSFFRFGSYFNSRMRAQWDPVARSVTLTSNPSEHFGPGPYPEEIPAEVRRFVEQASEGPLAAVFKPDSGGTFYVFGKKGGALRFRDDREIAGEGIVGITVAAAGEPGEDVVIAVRPRHPEGYHLGFRLSFSPDDRGIFLGQYAGMFVQQGYSTPIAAVRADAEWLGIGANDVLEEVFVGRHDPSGREVARVRFVHRGEEFEAKLFKEAQGWVLEAVTWGNDCFQFTLYCAD